MMTQSVMTQASNLFGNANASVTSRSNRSSGNGFEKLMDISFRPEQEAPVTAKNKQNQPVDRSKKAHTKTDASNEKVNKDDSAKADQESKVQAQNTQTDAAKASTKETKEVSKSDGKDTKAKAKEESLTPIQELVAQITTMLQKLQEVVMEALGLSEEEFNQLLEQYQESYGVINTTDLLDSDVLQRLVLLNKGTSDPCELLTDEKLEQTLRLLLESVEQIKSEANVNMAPQEMNTLLMQAQSLEVVNPEEHLIEPSEEMLQTRNVTKNVSKEIKQVDEAEGKGGSTITEDSNVTRISIEDDSRASSQTEAREEEQSSLDHPTHFQAFVDKLVQTSESTQVDMSGNLVRFTELRDIANQIIEQIKVVIKPDQTSMELMLNPEHLGKVNLSIHSKDGVMTAQFVVQNEVSKEAIESQMQSLRDTLNQQGIKVESVEVTVAAYAFEQNTQSGKDNHSEDKQNQTGRRITLEEAFAMNERSEDISSSDGDGLRGVQIDYTA